MKRELLPEALWERIKDLLPSRADHPRGGRPWKDDKAALRGIIFVLRTGIQWREVPQEVFGVSGVTCWRRLRDWQEAGVWARLQERLLDELGSRGRLDWSRAAADSASVAAKKGRSDWIKPHRPRATGLQASRAHRPGRVAAHRIGVAGQPA